MNLYIRAGRHICGAENNDGQEERTSTTTFTNCFSSWQLDTLAAGARIVLSAFMRERASTSVSVCICVYATTISRKLRPGNWHHTCHHDDEVWST